MHCTSNSLYRSIQTSFPLLCYVVMSVLCFLPVPFSMYATPKSLHIVRRKPFLIPRVNLNTALCQHFVHCPSTTRVARNPTPQRPLPARTTTGRPPDGAEAQVSVHHVRSTSQLHSPPGCMYACKRPPQPG